MTLRARVRLLTPESCVRLDLRNEKAGRVAKFCPWVISEGWILLWQAWYTSRTSRCGVSLARTSRCWR
jgi:hypothetical protein